MRLSPTAASLLTAYGREGYLTAPSAWRHAMRLSSPPLSDTSLLLALPSRSSAQCSVRQEWCMRTCCRGETSSRSWQRPLAWCTSVSPLAEIPRAPTSFNVTHALTGGGARLCAIVLRVWPRAADLVSLSLSPSSAFSKSSSPSSLPLPLLATSSASTCSWVMHSNLTLTLVPLPSHSPQPSPSPSPLPSPSPRHRAW